MIPAAWEKMKQIKLHKHTFRLVYHEYVARKIFNNTSDWLDFVHNKAHIFNNISPEVKFKLINGKIKMFVYLDNRIARHGLPVC